MSHFFTPKISWLGGRYGVLFLAFVVCLFFVGIWTYQLLQGRERAIASAQVNSENLVRIIEEVNNRTIQAVDLTLTNVATSLKPGGWAEGYDPNSFLRSLLSEAPQIREVAFADVTGRISAISRRGALGVLSIEHETYFSQAREGTLPPLYISTPRPGRLLGQVSQDSVITGQWHLIMARSVFNDAGVFAGVALAVINPGFFQEQIHALDIGINGFVAYYRYDGTLLVTSNISSLHFCNTTQANHPLFTKYLPEQEWGTFIRAPRGAGEATYIISYRATSRWPLLVTVGLNQGDALAPWRLEVRDFSILMAGSLMVLLGLAVMVYRQHVSQEKMALELVAAHHDPLTGIPSLRLCLDRLSNALLSARRENDSLAVFFIDLDGFKEINDKYGHSAGDYVLKEIAKRLKGCVRQMDTVARLGGDEFLIVLPKIKDISVVGNIGDKVIESVRKSIQWKGDLLSVSASVGIALHPKHGDEPEQLIKKADKAMYEAKRNGKGQVALADCNVLCSTADKR